MTERRFPPPWSVEELDACFVVRDSNGQQLAYVYFEDEPGRRSAAKLLSQNEARPKTKRGGLVPNGCDWAVDSKAAGAWALPTALPSSPIQLPSFRYGIHWARN